MHYWESAIWKRYNMYGIEQTLWTVFVLLLVHLIRVL